MRIHPSCRIYKDGFGVISALKSNVYLMLARRNQSLEKICVRCFWRVVKLMNLSHVFKVKLVLKIAQKLVVFIKLGMNIFPWHLFHPRFELQKVKNIWVLFFDPSNQFVFEHLVDINGSWYYLSLLPVGYRAKNDWVATLEELLSPFKVYLCVAIHGRREIEVEFL